MSEAERKRRLEYKKKRLKWIVIQIVALSLVAVVALGAFLTYYQLNKTYYVEYTEDGRIDYKVGLKDNEVYEEEWLGKDQAYMSGLIESVIADFKYDLNMNAEEVAFDYIYTIDADLLINDRDSGKDFDIDGKPTVLASGAGSVKGNKLSINEQVYIDYVSFNDRANTFVSTYKLKDYTSTLAVKMTVYVISKSERFETNGENSYDVTLNIPLTTNTVTMQTFSSVPGSESRVLAYTSAVNQDVFKILAIVGACIEVILLCVFICFIYLTRNEDINYTIKVKKLVSSYRSYIQQIENEFDTEGYQVLAVKTFNEMLGIRDTIQSPILMNENEDKTRTLFVIPTNTKVLYTFEIKVENYDELYGIGKTEEKEEEEPLILDENVDEEALEEAIESPDIVLDEVDFVPDDDPEEEEGVEVIGVVWPERAHRNKVYRYDPNGEVLSDGDVVLVPSRDVAKNRDIVRKAAVAHGNHRVPPESLHHPLKKIIGVVKRKAEKILTAEDKK